MTLSNEDKRTGFNQMIAAAEAAGDQKAATGLELAREYFTNPEFKAWMEGYVWNLTQAVPQ